MLKHADPFAPDLRAELTFELPLTGGDLGKPGRAEAKLGDLAPLLRAHLPADDPLAAYADRLEQPALGDQTLRGYHRGDAGAAAGAGGRDAGGGASGSLAAGAAGQWVGGAAAG